MADNPAPIFRFYRLGIATADRLRFAAEGRHNLLTSIENEPRTLAMAATHADAAGTDNYVFEVYRDAAAYQVHARSPQFKRYGALAATTITSREGHDLTPQVLRSRADSLRLSDTDGAVGRYLDVTVKPGMTDQVKTVLTSQVETALATEPGLLLSYAATRMDEEQRWVILEVFRDAMALQHHLTSNHTALTGLLYKQVDHQLTPDTLVTQGRLTYTA